MEGTLAQLVEHRTENPGVRITFARNEKGPSISTWAFIVNMRYLRLILFSFSLVVPCFQMFLWE